MIESPLTSLLFSATTVHRALVFEMRGFRQGLQAPREFFIDAKFDRRRSAVIPSARRAGESVQRTRNCCYNEPETALCRPENVDEARLATGRAVGATKQWNVRRRLLRVAAWTSHN
jgi:hypothetical protein